MTFRFLGETYKGYAAAHPWTPVTPEPIIIMSGCCDESLLYGENILLDPGLESHQVGSWIKHEIFIGDFANAIDDYHRLMEPPDRVSDVGFPLDRADVVYVDRKGQTFTTGGADDAAFYVGGDPPVIFPVRRWMPFVSDINPDTGSKHIRLTHYPAFGSLNSARGIVMQPAWWCSVFPGFVGGNNNASAAFVREGDVISVSVRAMASRLYTASGSGYPKIQIFTTYRDINGVGITINLPTPTGNAVNITQVTTGYQTYTYERVTPPGAYGATVVVAAQHGNVQTGADVHFDMDNFVLGIEQA